MVKAAESAAPSIEAQLRDAIVSSKLSRYRISQLSGVPASVICRMLKGADMKISNAAKIAAVLGLELRRK
jgi:predicted transcriptional regulator